MKKYASHLIQNALMAWSTDEEDATMLLDIPSPIDNVINVHLNLKLVDICFDNTLQILCKSLL